MGPGVMRTKIPPVFQLGSLQVHSIISTRVVPRPDQCEAARHFHSIVYGAQLRDAALSRFFFASRYEKDQRYPWENYRGAFTSGPYGTTCQDAVSHELRRVGTWSDHSISPRREETRHPSSCFFRRPSPKASNLWLGLPHSRVFSFQDKERNKKIDILGIFSGYKVWSRV